MWVGRGYVFIYIDKVPVRMIAFFICSASLFSAEKKNTNAVCDYIYGITVA